MPSPVTLHVYDVFGHEIAKSLNEVLMKVNTGAFHGAVEVNGLEYSFGGTDFGSGVFSCEPKGCEGHSYRESHPMGDTQMRPEEVEALVEQLMAEWPGQEYDLLRHNCCHFCVEFVTRLGVGPAPGWLTNLAGAGATVHTGAQTAMAKAIEIDQQYQVGTKVQAGAQGIMQKATEIDEQYKVKDKVQAGAQGLLQKAGEIDEQYKVRDNVQQGAQGLLQRAAELDQQYKVSDQVRTGAVGLAQGTQSAIAAGKEARGADAGGGYQFGDLTRGLMRNWGIGSGAGAAGSGGYTGAAAAGARGETTNARPSAS